MSHYEREYLVLSIPDEGQLYFDDSSLISECDLEMTLEYLKYCKRLKAAKYKLAALEAVHADSLSAFIKIKSKIEDLDVIVSTAKSMVDCTYSNSTDTTPLQDETNKVITESEAIVWATKHHDQILLAKQKVRDKQLASELGFEKGRRVGDDLDRFSLGPWESCANKKSGVTAVMQL